MDFLEQLAYGLKEAAKKPNVLSYRPNSSIHEAFHKSENVGRILRGGNRSGKSVAGVVESIWRATGKHPHQKTHDVPTRQRIVTVDNDAGIKQIIIPLLKQWIPPSELINGSWEDSYKNNGKVLTFRNGSTIELKTHQQEVESFAGVPLHFIWFDEECPQAIFNECRLRLIDFNGSWIMTMTPVEGLDWIYDRYIAVNAKNVEMFEVNISDNPHLNRRALELLDEDLDDEEKKIRQQGLFVPKGGLVLKKFDLKRHVIRGGRPVPHDWTIYVSVDHGFNAPTAILWHALSPKGEVVTVREHYMSQWTIKKHAAMIKKINSELGRTPTLYMCDPSMSQRTGESGSSALQIYRQHDIPLVQAKKDVNGRINKMNEYLEHDMWHITEDCPNTIRESRGYSFKIYTSAKIAGRNNVREEPNKKNDHTMDSAGYFFTFMPYLTDQFKNSPQVKSKFSDNLSETVTNMKDFPWEIDAGVTIFDFVHDLDSEFSDFGFGEVL